MAWASPGVVTFKAHDEIGRYWYNRNYNYFSLNKFAENIYTSLGIVYTYNFCIYINYLLFESEVFTVKY